MDSKEVRYHLISTMLQAGSPLTLTEVAAQSGVAETEILPVLKEPPTAGMVIQFGSPKDARQNSKSLIEARIREAPVGGKNSDQVERIEPYSSVKARITV